MNEKEKHELKERNRNLMKKGKET